MIFRHGIIILGIFLCFSSANAMEKEEDFQEVTVRIWKQGPLSYSRTERTDIGDPGHISLQTKNSYIGFSPWFGMSTPHFTLQDYFKRKAYSAATYERDLENQRSLPCEFFTFIINVKPVDAIWKQMLENCDTDDYFDSKEKPCRYKANRYCLEKVLYWDKPMKDYVNRLLAFFQ